MADCRNASGFKDAVCIDVGKVYDSCCDRDCLEDLRCWFTARGQDIIDHALNVRVRSAEVITVNIDVEPVTFNRGYYACDLSFFFLVNFEVFTAPRTQPIDVRGVCFFDKKVILYGGEGTAKVFSSMYSENGSDDQLSPSSNAPVCTVDLVDPVALDACLAHGCCCEPVRPIPDCVCCCVGAELDTVVNSGTSVYVTLGLFSIVKLIRDVQVLVPVYDFCIPQKECVDSSENPCELFRTIDFPMDEFFPPKADNDDDTSCGCR